MRSQGSHLFHCYANCLQCGVAFRRAVAARFRAEIRWMTSPAIAREAFAARFRLIACCGTCGF
jgi:hypothetical protein